jgi:hypothetical protein
MPAHWVGEVQTEWLSDGRSMRLTENVSFIDSKGVEWFACAGDIVDGASIPWFLWRAIGSPFVGKYRKASVIHDVYCKNKQRNSKRVHTLFHEIMIHDGVEPYKAHAMWLGVRLFGPRFKGRLTR